MLEMLLCGFAVSCLLSLNGFAAGYDDFLKQGYRWVSVDGPFACVSIEDLRKIPFDGGDSLKLKMVEDLKAYYLVRGAVVQVIKEDKSVGVSQIHIEGITTPLWTWSRYLSRQPIRDIIGKVETPPTPSGSPSPGGSAAPDMNAFPSASPSP
jgi:hypothetical protein